MPSIIEQPSAEAGEQAIILGEIGAEDAKQGLTTGRATNSSVAMNQPLTVQQHSRQSYSKSLAFDSSITPARAPSRMLSV